MAIWLTVKKKALHLSVFSSIKYVPVIRPTVCSTNDAQYNHLSHFLYYLDLALNSPFSICIFIKQWQNWPLNLAKKVSQRQIKGHIWLQEDLYWPSLLMMQVNSQTQSLLDSAIRSSSNLSIHKHTNTRESRSDRWIITFYKR